MTTESIEIHVQRKLDGRWLRLVPGGLQWLVNRANASGFDASVVAEDLEDLDVPIEDVELVPHRVVHALWWLSLTNGTERFVAMTMARSEVDAITIGQLLKPGYEIYPVPLTREALDTCTKAQRGMLLGLPRNELLTLEQLTKLGLDFGNLEPARKGGAHGA